MEEKVEVHPLRFELLLGCLGASSKLSTWHAIRSRPSDRLLSWLGVEVERGRLGMSVFRPEMHFIG